MKVSYIVKRIISAVVIMLAVATIIFFCLRVLPGDPAIVILGDSASEEALKVIRSQLGADRPIWIQYFDYIGKLLVGDLGVSMITKQPAGMQIWNMFPYTLNLAISSMIIGVLIGIPIGIWTAIRKNTLFDYVGRVFALVGFSFPAFYLGVLLLMIFSIELGLFPIIHQIRTGSISEHLYKLCLPALSIGLIEASFITRLTRSCMLEVLNEDYVRTAFAKGLKPNRVYFIHALKNVMIPVITAVGFYTGTILAGAVLTETVFNRPGLGKLLIGAINTRDYTLVQACLVTFSFIIVVVNLIVDLSYSLFDPRVKYE